MRATFALGCVLLSLAGIAVPASGAAPCQAHVILFVPSGVRPPAGHQQRIDQVVEYAEAFFRRELKRWGHDPVTMPFRRAADGRTEVTVMRGKLATAQYKPVTVRAEVMDALRRERRLEGGRQVWWILVYAGEPPAKFPGFLGGFGQEIGGWAVCNFDTTAGRIDPAAPLGSEFLEKIMLKGMIHELGHGFQLPHVGPLGRGGPSNTLMGPTHRHYRRVLPNGGPQVHLSEAEAAMLATHPAFRGASDDRGPLPQVEAQDMRYTVGPRGDTLIVSGRVRASQRPRYALVADESDARPGEYWTKTYVGKVGADGAFEVVISEPSASNGTLKTWFAFESGTQTGNGKLRGRDSGVPKAYLYNQRTWTFN